MFAKLSGKYSNSALASAYDPAGYRLTPVRAARWTFRGRPHEATHD
jgi:hypothetical protein